MGYNKGGLEPDCSSARVPSRRQKVEKRVQVPQPETRLFPSAVPIATTRLLSLQVSTTMQIQNVYHGSYSQAIHPLQFIRSYPCPCRGKRTNSHYQTRCPRLAHVLTPTQTKTGAKKKKGNNHQPHTHAKIQHGAAASLASGTRTPNDSALYWAELVKTIATHFNSQEAWLQPYMMRKKERRKLTASEETTRWRDALGPLGPRRRPAAGSTATLRPQQQARQRVSPQPETALDTSSTS